MFNNLFEKGSKENPEHFYTSADVLKILKENESIKGDGISLKEIDEVLEQNGFESVKRTQKGAIHRTKGWVLNLKKEAESKGELMEEEKEPYPMTKEEYNRAIKAGFSMGDFVAISPITPRYASASETYLINEIDAHSISAGKLVEKGDVFSKVAVIIKEYGQKVLKIIQVANEWIPKVISPLSEFWEDLKAEFSGLPQKIITPEGVVYLLTKQPGSGKALDTIMFLAFGQNKSYDIMFSTEAPTMYAAKIAMKQWLRENNYM